MKTLILKKPLKNGLKPVAVDCVNDECEDKRLYASDFIVVDFPADDIHFLLTLIEMNGDGVQYAFPGWQETKTKLETLL